MKTKLRHWTLQFYIYTRRIGLSHRLRLRFTQIDEDNRARILSAELHTQSRQFGVYQRLWFLPLYIYRADIRGVFLDQEFFYGIPTSRCLFSLGCTFVLVERTKAVPSIISSKALDSKR